MYYHVIEFGLDRLIEVNEATTFPWLISNVIDDETGLPLADGEVACIVHWKGWQIGIVSPYLYD